MSARILTLLKNVGNVWTELSSLQLEISRAQPDRRVRTAHSVPIPIHRALLDLIVAHRRPLQVVQVAIFVKPEACLRPRVPQVSIVRPRRLNLRARRERIVLRVQ